MNALITILVIAGLFIGGGTTVNAAQDDLPGEPLYAIKMWSEDVSLQFQDDSEARIDRLMELVQIRIQEMTRLVYSGQIPPDQVRLRLDQHIQQTLRLCSNLDDASLDQKLLQLRNQLREHERDMERLQVHAAQDAEPILERTRSMLQTRLRLVDEGLQNHEMFRNTIRNGFNYGQTETPPTAAPSTPLGPNGQQNGQSTPQAAPDNGNGPGPKPDATAAPTNGGSGSGSGNGSGGSSGGNSGNDSDGKDGGGNSGSGESGGTGGSGGSGSGGNKP